MRISDWSSDVCSSDLEFGLIREGGALRSYGAGIVSSYAESVFALDSDSPNRIGFDLARVMRTDNRIDDFQQNYFVVDSLDQLLDVTVNTDFAPLYAANAALPAIQVADIVAGDAGVKRGTTHTRLGKGGQSFPPPPPGRKRGQQPPTRQP